MQDNENILLDAHGDPIKEFPINPSSRHSITEKIYAHFIADNEAQDFIGGFLQSHPEILTSGAETIQISFNNEYFQAYCINYAAQSIINKALDENLPDAYSQLMQFSGVPYFSHKREDMTNITYDDLNKLGQSLVYVPELSLAKGMCDIQSEITGFLSGNMNKAVTSYQANRIQEKFEDLTPILTFEQRAAGYYNISIIHRALAGEKEYNNFSDFPPENSAEKECLKKVLEYTSDYKRIKYCANRLGDDFPDQSLIHAAYRRALTVTDIPADLYKINFALAESYLKDYNHDIGLTSDFKEDEKLLKAEIYYRDAFKHAQEPEKISILKNIAKIQFKQKNIQAWTETKTMLAMKFMTGEERCHALIEIANRNKEVRALYLEQALKEADKSRAIAKNKKKLILQKIDHYLRPILTAENNQQKTAELDAILQKYTQQAPDIPPLLKYIKTNKSKS